MVLRKNSSKYNSTTNFSNADSSQRSSITTLADSESPKIQRLAKSGLYINPSDALKFFSTQVNFHQYAKYGTYWLWSFQTGGTKLERFLPQNQHTQRKLLNFQNWVSGEVSKSAKSPNLLTFKVNFLCQKLSESFSIFFSLKNINLEAHFSKMTPKF